MSSFVIDLTESLGNLVLVVFFFLCIFVTYRILSRPEIKSVLKRGGWLPFFAVILIIGSWLYGTFSFLISDAFYFLKSLFHGSFGTTELSQFLKDLVVIGVFGFGSFFIYRSNKKGPDQSVGRSALLGLILILGITALTACTTGNGDAGQQTRDFLGSASWVVFYFLCAIAYLVAGLISYQLVNTSFINSPLRKLGLVPHILAYCVLTNMLFGVIYRPISYFFNFMQGIANQNGFLPVFSNILCAVLVVVGYAIVAYFSRIDRKPDTTVITAR